MSTDRQKVIDIALAEVGYLEKKTSSDLDNRDGNAGDGNYTKYARDLDAVPGFYNGKKNGYAWCDVFVDWCFVQAYGVAKAKKLLNHPNKSLGASCRYSASYYKIAGRFYTRHPQPGDQIFFCSGSTVTHTGLVYKVDSKKVYTVEGNTSGTAGVVANGGGVFRKSYSLTHSKIYGYGRPAYDDEKDATTTPSVQGGTKVTITLNILRKGSKGGSVRALQILLNGMGYSCGAADGDFGSKTTAAVKRFQKANGLTQDGVVGTDTWSAILA